MHKLIGLTIIFCGKPEFLQRDMCDVRINATIENLDILDKIQPSPMGFDEAGVRLGMEYYGDLFGDILEIKPGMGGLYCTPTNNLVHLMTMENMFIEVYDNPENFKIMMNRLADDYVKYFT